MRESDIMRREAREADKERDAGLFPPEEIARYVDIAYDNKDSKWNLLDLYRPKDGNRLLPVIVSVHGGGWVYGDKEVYQFYCMDLAKEGFVVVNFSYRLAPEYKFPAALEDTNSVMEWVFEHGAEYGMDLNQIFFVGDSAGAHLAALYMGICTNTEYARKYDFRVPAGLKPKAAALNCGVYDIYEGLNNKEGNISKLLEEIFEQETMKEKLELFHPVAVVTKEFPPIFLMTCENDFLVYQAPFMKKALEKAGVYHEYHLYGKGQKEIRHVFHCNIRLEEAKKCNKAECEFFKKFSLDDVIARVTRMEQYMDEVLVIMEKNPESIKDDEKIKAKIAELLKYHDSGQWLRDYECDERGELPSELKRGILSEDLLYNLLCEIRL